MIPAFVAISVVIAGLAITTSYVLLVGRKKNKDSDDLEFRCPECGMSVDGITDVCPECSAVFKEGEFECPVCSSTVTADAKVCLVCNERFEDEETFECPHCNEPIPPEVIVCEKCDAEFWSPIRPPTIAEVDTLVDMEESLENTGEVTSS